MMSEHVRILLEAFLRAGQDEIILRRRHRDPAALRQVPGQDGTRVRNRVDAHERIAAVQEERLRPGHPLHADRIVPRHLRPVRQPFHDTVPLRLGPVRDGEMLQDIGPLGRQGDAADAFAVQEIVQGDRSLSPQDGPGENRRKKE